MTPSLFVDQSANFFDRHAEGPLGKFLEHQDSVTSITSIDRPEQLMLTAEGKTMIGGYAYTQASLKQLANLLSYGLARLTFDLGGVRQKRDQPKEYFSLDDAIHILNVVIKRRFGKIDGIQAVRDTERMVFDGFVGSSYQRLSNYDLLQMGQDAISDRKPKFAEGVVVGRSLMVRYYLEEVLASPYAGDTWHAGFYFANSEVGDASVRGYPMIWRSDGTSLLNAGKVGTVRHTGRDFRTRLAKALSIAVDNVPPAELLRANLRKMEGEKLGLLGTPSGKDEDARIIDHLTNTITGKGIRRPLASRAVRGGLSRGAFDRENDRNQALLEHVRRAVWPSRSRLDLLAGLMRESRLATVLTREKAEKLGYQILMGQGFSWPKPGSED